jgi:hypothetical protein
MLTFVILLKKCKKKKDYGLESFAREQKFVFLKIQRKSNSKR